MSDTPARMLPYGRQSIDDSDVDAVVEVLRSNWLTQGPAVGDFEQALADVTGAAYVVACSSGTAALHMAYQAAGIGPGDVVVVPAITFLATANAARMTGSEVVFADVSPSSGLMQAEHVERAIEDAARRGLGTVRALAPVHLGGQVWNPPAVAALARDRNLFVLEDACHALGTSYADAAGNWHRVGACVHADAAVFSFHPVKTIVTGEGGVIATNEGELAARCRTLASHGMVRDLDRFVYRELAVDEHGRPHPWYYEMQELATNYRISDLHCALGASQLKRLESFATRRRSLHLRYRQRCAEAGPGIAAIDADAPDATCWHLFVALIDFERFGVRRADVMRALRDHGVGSQVHYIPVNQQPYYRERYGEAELPGAQAYYERCLSLPLFPDMADDDVDYVMDVLLDVLARRNG